MEVKIRYVKMTEEELNSVTETLADIIVDYIQARKTSPKKETDMKDSEHDQEESNDGTVQPV